MSDVAAPLYRIFLADAQVAARAGDTEGVLECLGLALDFAPESRRERVLLAAAELVPPVMGGVPGVASPRGTAPGSPLVVQLAPAGAGHAAPGRIAWEVRGVPPAGEQYPVPASLVAPTSRSLVAARRPPLRLAVVAAMLAALIVGFGWLPAGAVAALRGDPVERAALALATGKPGVALRFLEPLGAGASPRVWLLRAAAHEALADTAAAVAALETAAARDAEGGGRALEAGDRLGKLGRVSEAADAYLFAVTSLRSDTEVERIARMQERAGHADRARRVRRR